MLEVSSSCASADEESPDHEAQEAASDFAFGQPQQPLALPPEARWFRRKISDSGACEANVCLNQA